MKRPDRKRNRLPGYDYSRDGMYFVTVFTHDRIEWFGCVEDGAVVLNGIGTIADEQWQWLGKQYPYVVLGPYVVMPNHIHALIQINRSLQAQIAVRVDWGVQDNVIEGDSSGQPRAVSLAKIVS